jgi:CDP-paratose 2-epimerase
MKLLITGISGFVGSSLVKSIRENGLNFEIVGIDNLSRRGSERNIAGLKSLGVQFFYGDLRNQSDVDSLPPVDWVIDAAANPSVLAGADGKSSTRQVIEHNLLGTINLLEKCRREKSGFVLLSTSRVYSIPTLAALSVTIHDDQFVLDHSQPLPENVTDEGISESFSTLPPVSLYGATKLTSETLALEYGDLGGFPVWINRCGVMAGAGQFGRADQGIFTYWVNAHLRHRPLRYIGFDGLGHQVRDCLHPRDLVPLLRKQFDASAQGTEFPRIVNLSGGRSSAMSLRQLTKWCDERFGAHSVESDPSPRLYDLPWVVLDHKLASSAWNWQPTTIATQILEEIAEHAIQNPEWLELSV